LKAPRDLSGRDLTRALLRLGYHVDRQTGSHTRLTATGPGGGHHLTIPAHRAVKPGTLSSILRELSTQTGLQRHELLHRLFG
jgi:predicted RNA binding protein YcfA (HicA-like mRNA interferase family)